MTAYPQSSASTYALHLLPGSTDFFDPSHSLNFDQRRRPDRPCHADSGLRSRWRSSSQGDEENQPQGVPVPSGNHPAGDLALRPVYPELSRRRRFVGGTRYHGVLRNCPALGEPLKPYTTWHLDEVYLKIDGRMVYLWRAVDAEGELLDVLVQAKR